MDKALKEKLIVDVPEIQTKDQAVKMIVRSYAALIETCEIGGMPSISGSAERLGELLDLYLSLPDKVSRKRKEEVSEPGENGAGGDLDGEAP